MAFFWYLFFTINFIKSKWWIKSVLPKWNTPVNCWLIMKWICWLSLMSLFTLIMVLGNTSIGWLESMSLSNSIILWDCFPKTLSPQTLDYGTINEQMKIDVGFSYHYWTNLNTEATLPQPLNDRITEVVTNSVRNQFFSRLPAIYQKGVSLFR